MKAIQYTQNPDNCREMMEFIGKDEHICKRCGGTGEYEDNGPHGCQPCNSRLLFFENRGQVFDVDWDDFIVRDDDGLLWPVRYAHVNAILHYASKGLLGAEPAEVTK